MARGVNKVILVGNLGADPETKYTPSGTAVANVRVATTKQWKDKNSGEQQERTEWHRVVFFNRTAEVAGEYLKKGAQVYIEGELRTNKWRDQQGNDRYTTEIVANDMQMLGGRGGGQQVGGQSSGPPQGGGDHQAPPASDDFDDDIPFLHAWVYPAAGTLAALMSSIGGAPGVA